jgi:hypothetical protein
MTSARNEYAAELAVAAFMKKTYERNIIAK